MPDGSTAYIILLVLFIIGGAYFAGAEISLASVSKIHITSLSASGDKRAKKVLFILDNFEKALTTLLIGNNVMHIGCATLSTLLATSIWGIGSVKYATLITTAVLFLIAEMIPKCFAKSCNEAFALAIAPSLSFLMTVLTPVSFVFSKLGELLSSPFKKFAPTEYTVTKKELSEIVEGIPENGDIPKDSSVLVKSALSFSDLTVKEAMTPWECVEALEIDCPIDLALEKVKRTNHSRLLLTDKENEVCGVLQIRKFLKYYARNKFFRSIKSVSDRPFFVFADEPICDALHKMSAAQTNLAVITDRESKPCGITTVEAITLKLIGNLRTEKSGRAGERK